MSKNDPPVAKLTYSVKGEKAQTVGAVWLHNHKQYGPLYTVSPQLEADEYSNITLPQAIEKVAQGDGFINLMVFGDMPKTKLKKKQEDDELP